MPKTISHFEVGVTQTWVVVNDNGSVTLRVDNSRSSEAHTLSAGEAIHRWPTLAREIKTAIWEICGEAAPKLLAMR